MNRRGPRSPRTSPRTGPPAGSDDAGGVISSLSVSRRDPDRVTVRIGRAKFGPIDRRDAEELGLRPGVEWTRTLAGQVAAAQARAGARRYALRALAARPMSRRELTDRMTARGCNALAAESVAARLEDLGLIDDAAFAQSYVRSQLARKPAGKALLVAKLMQKRIEPGTARRAVETALKGTDQAAAAAVLAQKRALRMSPELGRDVVRRRLMGLLARRGFDGEVCRGAVDIAMKSWQKHAPAGTGRADEEGLG
ncbi:MAG: regulatory protein RecX [Phycisphaeraceae bacterium]|nr:regulatory protein RecX [Phycisphaeraceae bacterium]